MTAPDKDIPARERLIFAMDVADTDAARRMAERLGDSVRFYKLGLELFMAGGYFELLDWMVSRGNKVFVDLKFFDVPATVAAAVGRLRNRGVALTTVHGNQSIMEAAAAAKGDVKVLAVTVLTSLDRGDLDDLGFDCDVPQLVLSRARRALEAGCDGVVSSGLEAPMLRQHLDQRLLVVTPGIRPVENRPADDQKRTVDVAQAFANGADYIVVGRPIRDATDPRAAAEAIQETIAGHFGGASAVSAALANDLLLRALLRQPTPRTPVWMMRQAGRYLPEYRATRERAGSFLTLCTTPELACEVTLQPARALPARRGDPLLGHIDDPARDEPRSRIRVGRGPRIARPVRTAADIARLGVPDPERDLRYVLDAVRLVRRELGGRVPLIGFAGSPWTVATYMVEGGGSKTFGVIKGLLYGAPRELHRLLAILTHATRDYLNAQIAAGAQAVMVFDTWGGVLEPSAYREFSLAYMQTIVDGLTREREGRRVPVILFTKGGGAWLEEMAASGCDALGVDWTTDLADARRACGDRVALQGNLDPGALYGPPARIRDRVARVLASYGRAAVTCSISGTASIPTYYPSTRRR